MPPPERTTHPRASPPMGRSKNNRRQVYTYNPHLPPKTEIRRRRRPPTNFPNCFQKAQQGPLSAEEVQILAEALRHHSPWLEWASKQEAESFAVDPVALHIHERVSAKAIVKVAERENAQRELFADPQQEYREAVQFYQHDVDWTNRLILGDGLTVMSSLAATRRSCR